MDRGLARSQSRSRAGGWVEQPVRLYRDEWGIPHVRARSVRDVFVGQGYVHAMDRLWQMDAARKQMEGRWAEWVGAAGLPTDRLARRLRAGAASIRDYRSFDCLLPMLAATSVDSLFQAVRGWGLIDHNLAATDTGGHIGHLVRAVIPRRPASNGWLH